MAEDKESSMDLYFQVSSCMGIIDWYSAKSIIGKIFWASLVFIGLGMTLFQTYGTFDSYLTEKPFKITVSRESIEGGIQFPLITICNYNRARQSVINATNLDPNVLTYLFELFPNDYTMELGISPSFTNYSIYQKAWDDYVKNTGESSHAKFFQKFGHDKDSIIHATYSRILSLTKFTEVFTIYGRCWQLNFNFSQMLPGAYSGVKLLLHPQLFEYMKDVPFNNYYEEGFAISISYTEEPLMSGVLKLAPGSSVDIELKTTRNVVSSSPYQIRSNPCQANGQLNIVNASYTQKNCFFDCYMQSVYHTCGCVLLSALKVNVPICNMSAMVLCANPTTVKNIGVSLLNITHDTAQCSANCKNPCEGFLTVEATMTATKQRVPLIQDIIQVGKMLGEQNNWSDSYVREAFETGVTAKIYFASNEMTVSETSETTDIMTFISNVGGMLGLWLGISTMSIIQVVYYFAVGCCEYIGKKKKSQQITSKGNVKFGMK